MNNNNNNNNEKKSFKFLFISFNGLSVDTAWHIKKEGNEVKYFIENINEKDVGDGFIDKIDNWEKEVEWADVIVFDDVFGQGEKANNLRKKGKYVIGGTSYTDKLEDDRAFGQEELKKIGVSIPLHKAFSSFDSAIEYVKENPGKYYLKPSGDSQIIKDLLFIGEDDEGLDVIQVLNDYKNAWESKIPKIQLQKRIAGVEVAIGGFFNGKEFIYPININFEYKSWFPANLGPATADMGTSMFWSGSNKIFNQTLKKMEPIFAKEGYVGYIDLKCIVNSHGIYPLDWTTRFGYPTISVQQESMITPFGEFLYNLAKGENFTFKVKSGFHIGVRLVVPPFPFNDPETFNVKSKDSVITFKKEKHEGVHIEDVKIINGEWVITGTTGVVLIVCGSGQTMKQAKQMAYNRIKNINIPHMYYRDDIGESWFEDSDKLHAWGYLREN
jgi:phosphoribosylamine---glycine ligase